MPEEPVILWSLALCVGILIVGLAIEWFARRVLPNLVDLLRRKWWN